MYSLQKNILQQGLMSVLADSTSSQAVRKLSELVLGKEKVAYKRPQEETQQCSDILCNLHQLPLWALHNQNKEEKNRGKKFNNQANKGEMQDEI